uniref:Uncharacterized protein n=1 Tax=Aegilops tauschii subsp. strangulata TaxID=200361 RepID=A0A453FZC6_AEGTS
PQPFSPLKPGLPWAAFTPHALSLLFPTPDLLAPRVFSWFGSPPHCLRRNPSVFSHSYEDFAKFAKPI